MENRNYAGISDEFAQLDSSRVVLIPVPYDGTSTWQKGSNNGPAAFLEASENMELYDIETRSEVYRKGIYLAPEVSESSSPEQMAEAVYLKVKKYLKIDKFLSLIGGEHSISIGAIKAYSEKYNNLTVLQLDAHTDLREEYMGSKCNHACAMYLANKSSNLIQVGIRSMDYSELKEVKEDNVFYAHQIHQNTQWMDKAIERMTDEVYITIDLDVLDPSIMPSTGTPEPGGLLWYQTLEFLKKTIDKKKIVGFDIVELCPNTNEKSSDFLAAKLYYKILSYIFK